MKATKLVTTAAIATLGLTLLAPSALAEGSPWAGAGDITFSEDTGKLDPTDPEKPGKIDPPGTVNPTGGPFAINVVSDLHFKGENADGSAKISTNKGEFFAGKPVGKVEGKELERGNWVQVTDMRAVDKNGPKGWKLSAALTKQFANTEDDTQKIDGATITYTNPVVTAEKDKEPRPDLLLGSDAKFTAGATKVLEFKDGGSESVEMATAKAGSGFGTYYLQFGRSSTIEGVTEDTTANSVKLTVPSNTPVAAKKYVAEITWTLSDL